MDRKPLRIGKKVAQVPIIQGGMGIGISLGGLSGAVAKEGGIGIISAAQIGFREPDFDKNPKKANLRAVKTEYEKARRIAPEGLIGFNIMVAMRGYEDYVHAAVDAGADLIVSGAGLPTDLPKIVQDSDVKIAPIVSTAKSAAVILKYWDRKYHRIPDLLVIEGPKAGGHLGFQPEELAFYQQELPCDGVPECASNSRAVRYDEEVRKILSVVRDYEERYGTKIPAALGGGISDRQAADHAFSLGADAIQVATRFITTKECDADIRYKKAYLQIKEEDVVITKSPVGMPGRAIRNRFIERVASGEKIPHTPCHGCLHKCDPANIPYCITDALIHAAKGELDEALLFCGADAWKAERMETVKEVIDSLVPGRV